MMSKRTLFLLVLSIALWSVALLSSYAYLTRPADDTALREERLRLTEAAIGELVANMDDTDRSTESTLEELSKLQFRSMLIPLRRAAYLRDSLNQELDVIHKAHLFGAFNAREARLYVEEIAVLTKSLLFMQIREYYLAVKDLKDYLALRDEDLAEILSGWESTARQHTKSAYAAVPPTDKLSALEAAAAIQLSFYLASRDLQMAATSMYCYRGCSFGPTYYPVIIPEAASGKRGEEYPLTFSVGSYSTSLSREHVKFIVNGDTLLVGDDGTVKYFAPTLQRGEHEAAVELLITNYITGEVWRRESRYSYFVR